MVPSVQGVVPSSNIKKFILTGDIPWTGVKDAVLYDAFMIPTKLKLSTSFNEVLDCTQAHCRRRLARGSVGTPIKSYSSLLKFAIHTRLQG
jgi:hypothetical protein